MYRSINPYILIDYCLPFSCVIFIGKLLYYKDGMSLLIAIIIILLTVLWKERKKITEVSILQWIKIKMKAIEYKEQEIKDLYKNMLTFYVTNIENSSRWSGWSEKRRNEEMQKISEICTKYNIPKTDVFHTRDFWKKMDELNSIVNELIAGNKDQSKEIEGLWTKIVQEEIPAVELISVIDRIPLSKLDKERLRTSTEKIINN